MVKRCTKCGEVKELSEFSLRKLPSGKQGHVSQCKVCDRARYKVFMAANPHRQTRADVKQIKLRWERENPHKVREAKLRWAQANPEIRTKILARYRATKIKACPPWADKEAIVSKYREARRCTEETGIKYEVDHIIPLQGKYVSGLHVPDNLQVLTVAANRQKSNKFMEV